MNEMQPSISNKGNFPPHCGFNFRHMSHTTTRQWERTSDAIQDQLVAGCGLVVIVHVQQYQADGSLLISYM